MWVHSPLFPVIIHCRSNSLKIIISYTGNNQAKLQFFWFLFFMRVFRSCVPNFSWISKTTARASVSTLWNNWLLQNKFNAQVRPVRTKYTWLQKLRSAYSSNSTCPSRTRKKCALDIRVIQLDITGCAVYVSYSLKRTGSFSSQMSLVTLYFWFAKKNWLRLIRR